MKYFLFLTFAFLFSCKNEPKTTKTSSINASNVMLAGNWLAIDFIARASDAQSTVKAKENNMEPYAYAFSFTNALKDSVNCFNESKTWRLPVRFNVDTVEIKNATPEGKSVYLVYHSGTDKTMDLINTTSNTPTIQRFTRTQAVLMEPYVAFNIALNTNFFRTKYQLINKKDADVIFGQDGQVTGLPNIDFFRLCIAGNCRVAGEFHDVIYLGNSKTKTGEFYEFRSSVQRDSFFIYNLKSETPTIPKSSVIKNTAFTLIAHK
jgi:hypothetical protein